MDTITAARLQIKKLHPTIADGSGAPPGLV
jgi:hypothetical protein